MGTFHDDKHRLHGVTVVVDTPGPLVYLGRCDDMDGRCVVLLDADVHDETRDGRTKQEYLQSAARFGFWKKHDRLEIARDRVKSVTPLGDLAAD